MPAMYKAVQSSLASKDGIKKWFPRLAKFRKAVSTQQVAEMIAEKSSLTPGDVHNVIRNMVTVMGRLLLNSQTVKLDGLGTFTLIAKSSGNGVDTPEKVSPSQIRALRIQFTPEGTRAPGGALTRAIFSGIQYERLDGNSSMFVVDDDEEDPDDTGGGEEDIDPEA